MEYLNKKLLADPKELYVLEELSATKPFVAGTVLERKFMIGKNRHCVPVTYVELTSDEVEFYKECEEVPDATYSDISYIGKCYWDHADNSRYIGWCHNHIGDFDPQFPNKNDHKWSILEMLMEISAEITALNSEEK